ncbi:hypothetical protein BN1723_010378 [Verticillium longisporum]|uniref:Uncharacterized protein n=1 Tax=Verticillium longisporum TaxID=100787 RepID=A0A0G4KYN7_VERLO|nr:hypothetical protein BN1723_010378 [Verticillium longisporum]
METNNHMLEVLKKVQSKSKELGVELSSKELQVLKSRLTFLWEPVQSDATDITKWRHRRSRRGYEEVQDIDNHLFLAVVLSVNPTECGQTRFQAVVNHLRNLGHYGAYHFAPKVSTVKALQTLSDKCHIANNSRYRRLMEEVTEAKIEFAFSQVPMEKLSLLSGFVMDAITTSSKFRQETAQGEPKTTCVNIFLRPREEDGSIVITAGSRTLHMIRNALAMSEWDINKT